MRAELYRPEDPATTVAVATWSGGRASIEALTDPVDGLQLLLRPTPVAVDDPSLRHLGTSGASVLEPGSSQWFRAALQSRVGAIGLAVRFVADAVRGGWDPASQYLAFEERIDDLTSR